MAHGRTVKIILGKVSDEYNYCVGRFGKKKKGKRSRSSDGVQ